MRPAGFAIPARSSDQAGFLKHVRIFVPFAEAMGVPGAVMVAQAVIESGWGRSGLARLGGAWFGVKAGPEWRGSVYSGTTREWIPAHGTVIVPGTHRVYPSRAAALAAGCRPGALFRAYASAGHNVRDYLRFFHANPRYHRALERYARSRDPRAFAVDIAAAGYATAPDYAPRLIAVMEQVAPELLMPREITIWLDGTPLPAGSLLISRGRAYVRIRVIAGALGWRIAYDHLRKAVLVTSAITSGPKEAER